MDRACRQHAQASHGCPLPGWCLCLQHGKELSFHEKATTATTCHDMNRACKGCKADRQAKQGCQPNQAGNKTQQT